MMMEEVFNAIECVIKSHVGYYLDAFTTPVEIPTDAVTTRQTYVCGSSTYTLVPSGLSTIPPGISDLIITPMVVPVDVEPLIIEQFKFFIHDIHSSGGKTQMNAWNRILILSQVRVAIYPQLVWYNSLNVDPANMITYSSLPTSNHLYTFLRDIPDLSHYGPEAVLRLWGNVKGINEHDILVKIIEKMTTKDISSSVLELVGRHHTKFNTSNPDWTNDIIQNPNKYAAKFLIAGKAVMIAKGYGVF